MARKMNISKSHDYLWDRTTIAKEQQRRESKRETNRKRSICCGTQL